MTGAHGKALRRAGILNKGGDRQQWSKEPAMPSLPDPADLEALRAFDTPTICNALEIVAPARRATGFTRRPLIAAFARTAIIRSREPHPRGRQEALQVRLGYYEHIAAAPLPSIAIIQDIDGA